MRWCSPLTCEVLFKSALGGHHVSWVSPKLTEVLSCKLGKALSLWSEAVLEGLALWYLTCHESELMTRTRGEIMDEGVLDSVKSDLFRVLWTYE